MKKKKRVRSAVSGKFLKKYLAKQFPAETIEETIMPRKAK